MNSLNLRCGAGKCVIDNTTEMEIKKCITQNLKDQPDKFQPCSYLIIRATDEYAKGEVWKKFGDIIDKTKKRQG